MAHERRVIEGFLIISTLRWAVGICLIKNTDALLATEESRELRRGSFEEAASKRLLQGRNVWWIVSKLGLKANFT